MSRDLDPIGDSRSRRGGILTHNFWRGPGRMFQPRERSHMGWTHISQSRCIRTCVVSRLCVIACAHESQVFYEPSFSSVCQGVFKMPIATFIRLPEMCLWIIARKSGVRKVVSHDIKPFFGRNFYFCFLVSFFFLFIAQFLQRLFSLTVNKLNSFGSLGCRCRLLIF